MFNHSISVLALNTISAVTSGVGIFVIAQNTPQLGDVPQLALFGGAIAGTGLIQRFINDGWKPFFQKQVGISGAIIGGIATGASFISATAGWLMMFDSVGLQQDLQAQAVAPHTQLLQSHEVKYIDLAHAFGMLSSEMQSLATFESTTGPSCQNDEPANWIKKCGPRCRFMNRSASLTDSMSQDAQGLADKMSDIALILATGSQAEIDKGYTDALRLQKTPEMSRLRTDVRGLERELSGTITDPETDLLFQCSLPEALELVQEAEESLSAVLQLPARPTRPEPKVDDSMLAAIDILRDISEGNDDTLRAGQKLAVGLAALVEFLLLLSLRRDARRELEEGVVLLEPERFERAKLKFKLRNVENAQITLGLLDRYTVNGGKWGRLFAVPYDGEDDAFRSQCLAAADYLSLRPSSRASGAVDMHDMYPEWVIARAQETGHATQYELYELPKFVQMWRRVIQRAIR